MWAISLDLGNRGGFLSCLLGDECCVCKSAAKSWAKLHQREHRLKGKWNSLALQSLWGVCQPCLSYFWQAKSFNQLFTASFLFTGAAHNNSYQLIIFVLLDKVLFGVTKIKGKQSMSSLFQIHCHCSGPASQQISEHLKSVLSAEQTWTELLSTSTTTTTTTTQTKCF